MKRFLSFLLVLSVRGQEESEEEGPQVDPNVLFMTQYGSMQGSLAIPFLMAGGGNGQSADYLQYLLLKNSDTCDDATKALTYMMMFTSDDVIPLLPMMMTRLSSNYKTLSMFYLMNKLNRRVLDPYGRVTRAGLDMQSLMIYQDLRKSCGTSSTTTTDATTTTVTTTTTSITTTSVANGAFPLAPIG
ncbi:Oidioi.mRNA.OKI2018_I69.XSR.g16002.t1.cds [Oikopleura dioica]|uniref:Oidioi.mRNA.OKI2018_I69.XSR.g16002.t1.cds n=1 Tax=Oikopleura dioica TaxID=34765 RepID=A0ABN7SEN6_OIKDI|nr:Oidioi.mRNA.OKI2018_I69.XSR.g16002.t1.cds [Oikopleura dioica]